MKLYEIAQDDEQAKFDKWIADHVQNMLTGETLNVEFDGKSWSVEDPINLIGNFTEIPWPMTHAGGMIQIKGPKLKSLKNIAPRVKEGFAIIGECRALESLEYMPREIDDNMNLLFDEKCKVKSLKGIHKLVDRMTGPGEVLLGPGIKSHVLGLLKIPGVKQIDTAVLYRKQKLEIAKVCDILNKYAGQGLKGVVQAQRELIENDLDDYAEE